MDLIASELKTIAAAVAADQGVELVHVEIVGSKRDSVVRVFIDRPEGIGIDDCSMFSHSLEALLDAKDPIPGSYILEVSSPGIERELYTLEDFVRFRGELARVKTDAEINGQKNFVGLITNVDGSMIEIEDRTQGNISFDHGSVVKANLKMDLGKELNRR